MSFAIANNIYFPILAATPDISTVSDFEEDIRQAGRRIAEEKGLLLDKESFAAYEDRYNNVAIMSNEEIETFYEQVRANSVSMSEIYAENPVLADAALSIDGLDPVYLAPLTSTYANPAFGDYRLQDYYTYSERIEYDDVSANTYDGLSNLSIGIISLGLKPAQAIIVTVLQSVIPNNPWREYSDYHLTTLYEDCLSQRWGEVYTSGGLLGETNWRGYCYAQRKDMYAIAVATTWKANRAYSNTSPLTKVSYSYDAQYYNSSYIKARSLALYQQAYDETYTPMCGVLPGYLEYNWKNTKSNPFS